MGQKAGLLILSAWFALVSAHVSALGLGAITLKSNLNQPLSAEIELLELRGLTESEILVGLASQDDFDRVGVDRNYFLTDLTFKVNLTGQGNAVININSSKVVREPYLNFVILVRWPSGKLLREYTVLMDLPVFSEQAPTAITSAQTSKVSTRRSESTTQEPAGPRYNPRTTYDQAPARSSTSGTQNNSGTKYTGDRYEVSSNDTLWEIALQVRPDNSVSVHQTMLAIQSANPNAFINKNINLLKKGQILRIPEKDTISSLNQRQAVMEVKDQVQRWAGNEDVSAAPLEASSSYSSQNNKESTSVEGRVKLAAPEEAYGSEQGRGAGASSNTNSKALEIELSSTLEELDKSSRENNELRSKVQALEEQMKTMERLIEIGNEDLLSMELSAKARSEAIAAAKIAEEAALAAAAEAERMAREAAQQSNAAIANNNETLSASEREELLDKATGDVVASEPVVTPVAKETPVAEVKPTVAPAPVMESKGIVDLIIDNILYIGLGLILVLAVGGFLIQRKMSNSEFDDDDDDEFFDGAEFPDEDQGYDEDIADVSSAYDETDSGDFELEDTEEPESFVEEVVDEEPEENEPETEDVVAEADIYIAYGKYEQAEEMLLKAIGRDPSFHEARLKLLETYAAEQDIGRFDPHFAKLVAVGSSDLTGRAEHLRESIGDAPDFNSSDYDTSEFEQLVESSDFELPEIEDLTSDELVFDELDVNEGALTGESAGLDDLDSIPDSGLELDDFEFDLDGLDFDDDKDATLESEGAVSELDLDLADGTKISEPGDDDLEFDLSDLNLDDEELLGSASEPEDDDLEFDLSSLDESLDDDLSTNELSLDGLDESKVESDLEISLDVDDLDLDDLDLDDLDLDTLELGGSEQATEERADLDELSLELDDLQLEASESDDLEIDLPEADVDLDATSDSLNINLDDDLSLDDLDLSALDDELEAMSKDLDVNLGSDLDDLDLDESEKLDISLDAGIEVDDLEVDDLEIDGLEVDDLEVDDLEIDGLEVDDLEIDDLEIDGLEVDDLEDVSSAEESEYDLSADLEGLDNLVVEEDVSSAPTEEFARLDTSVDFILPDIDPDSVEDDDLDFLSDSDETATKLDLARAYIDMGDAEGARDIIDEIIKEGSDLHKEEAESLLARLDA